MSLSDSSPPRFSSFSFACLSHHIHTQAVGLYLFSSPPLPCHISITRQNGYGLLLGSHLHISLSYIFQKVAMGFYSFFAAVGTVVNVWADWMYRGGESEPYQHGVHSDQLIPCLFLSYLRLYMLDWIKKTSSHLNKTYLYLIKCPPQKNTATASPVRLSCSANRPTIQLEICKNFWFSDLKHFGTVDILYLLQSYYRIYNMNHWCEILLCVCRVMAEVIEGHYDFEL